MRSISIDIETKGTDKNSFVLAIGACAFDDSGFNKNIDKCKVAVFYGQVPWDDPAQAERVVDASTLQCWDGQAEARRLLQSPNSQEIVYQYKGLVPLLEAYLMFVREERSKDGKIIAQGTDFDCAILDQAIKYFDLEVSKSWKFWDHQCLRAFADAAHRAGVSQIRATIPVGDKKKFVKHHAADDAMQQAAKYQAYSHELWKLSQRTAQKGLEFIS